MCKNFESKLNVYIRSERAMLDIFMRDKLRQLLLVVIGVIALFTALIMLDLSLFFTLKSHFSTEMTAFILGDANILVFVVSLLFSKRKKHRKEVEALKEIRDFAKEEVLKDVKVATDEVVEVGQSVGHVVQGASSIFNGEVFSLASLLATINTLLKNKK